ncbi:maternal protein exuperantia [Scaptodrosophila lebanonensis]|uniref:Maternal protein exuperantia n=1 Tax=Drosophila lebanonensis TaxID=7225 RepID=A0A6J2UG99_DROLE|nr:maternal protein exuperantia [Scaptodrosophila lebanonensis]XP_030387166.1 maternal protein exuperantia [Scaptodrosophila lebanonensis]
MVADNIAIAAADQSSSAVGVKEQLPNGNYILVGVDIDTTGRRLIDEIVQLAAYTPTDHFEQYIMPYMNLNPAARQRHQVRVISIGFYRMLKSMQTYKIIKSKSEIAALKDFLDWLEQLKSKNANSDGIVLVYHEERKFIPYMILESLKKYSLLDRFTKTVKSFANGLNLAKSSISDTKRYTLRKLSKILSKTNDDDNKSENIADSNNNAAVNVTNEKRLKNGIQFEREEFDGNASVRAKLAFNVALQLSNGMERKAQPESSEVLENLFNALKPFAKPIGCDIRELDTQNENLERQNSFRPVFLNYFKTTLYHRVRAVKFRIVLAEQGFDLTTLSAIWSEKHKEGITEALQAISNLKSEDKTELIELLDSYFDPNKTTIKPVVKTNNNRRRNRRGNLSSQKNGAGASSSRSASAGAGGDKSQSVLSVPDSTIKTPSPSSKSVNGNSSRPQRKRNSRNSLNTNGLKPETPLNKSAPPTPSVAPATVVTNIPIAASN